LHSIPTRRSSDLVVTKDTTIILTKSIGVEQAFVKDYTGENIDTAKSELEDLGFKVETKEVDSKKSKDTIVKQSYKNVQLPVDSTIYFNISNGKKEKSDSDEENSKDEDKDDEDSLSDKTYNQTVYIPFTGSDSKKGQKVEIFIKDK